MNVSHVGPWTKHVNGEKKYMKTISKKLYSKEASFVKAALIALKSQPWTNFRCLRMHNHDECIKI